MLLVSCRLLVRVLVSGGNARDMKRTSTKTARALACVRLLTPALKGTDLGPQASDLGFRTG